MESPSPPRTEACLRELERVLSAQAFVRAPRLSSLLRYICERSLSADHNELSEQQIGIHVFGRAPGYNSAEDTIVRGTARHLRQRLQEFYDDEGREDPLRIGVPKGAYVAHFAAAPGSGQVEDGTLVPGGEDGASMRRAGAGAGGESAGAPAGRWPRSAVASVLGFALLAVGLGGVLLVQWQRSGRGTPPPNGPTALWRLLFTPDRKTLIVPGDAALDLYTSFEQREVPLEEYSSQRYQTQRHATSRPPNGDVAIGTRSMTPMADLRLVADLVCVPYQMDRQTPSHQVEIRYARDVSAVDIRENNLILIGGESFNPWGRLYAPALDFQLHWDYRTNLYTVTNRAAKAQEQVTYTYTPAHGPQGTLTVVALLDNLQGEGKVLLVQGSTMGSTYGAVNFLSNRRLWEPVLSQATDATGRLHNFEVLLGSDFVRGGLKSTRVYALHVHG